MQITPDSSNTEERLNLIECLPENEILTQVTGREEISFDPHKHNRHQIIYILSGTLHIETEETSYFVTDRHLVWIPRGIEHRLSSNNRQITIVTSYFFGEGKESERFAVYRTDELIARNLKLISQYRKISQQQNPELFAFANSFFHLLPQIASQASFPAHPFILTRDPRLQPILEYITHNLNQDLRIETVASTFGFSVRNLTRLFTNSGIRFVHYVNYQRIVRAIEILTDKVLNIEETAYEVGFNSPNSFGRVFKQITGESPSAFLNNRSHPDNMQFPPQSDESADLHPRECFPISIKNQSVSPKHPE